MSFDKKTLNQTIPSNESLSSLPKILAEIKPCLKNPALTAGLLERIQQESGQKTPWADRHPVCARELVLALFSKTKLQQVVTPFFSLCAQDPALKKALLKVISNSNSDAQSVAIHDTLEKNIETIAKDPVLFFELGHEALKSKNRRLVLSLLTYCSKNLGLAQNNLQLFSDFVKRVVHTEDLVVLEDILVKGLDCLLEKKTDRSSNNGHLTLETLYNYRLWSVLDLLIEKDKISSMSFPTYYIEKQEHPEKIILLIANGVIIEKPSTWRLDRSKIIHQEKAYAFYQMHQTLHSQDLTIEFLNAQNPESLWSWLCFDHKAASVLIKHPDFFVSFLLKQSDSANFFDRALKAYVAAGIFNPIAMGIPLLFKAISLNQCQVVKALIRYGVPPNAIDAQSEWSAFETALRSPNLGDPQGLELFEFFLNHPSTDCRILFKDGSHPIDVLFESNLTNKHSFLKAMLKKGFVLSGIKLSLLQQVQCLQPFDLPALKLLISHGISLSEKTSNEDTLLHVLICSYANASEDKRNTFLHLIRHIAVHDPKHFEGVINKDGKTVLDITKEMDLPEVVLTLLQAGITEIPSTVLPDIANKKGFEEDIVALLHARITQVSSAVLPESSPFDRGHSIKIALAYKKVDAPTSPSELQPWITLTNLEYFFGDAINKYGKLNRNEKPRGNSFNESAGFLSIILSVCKKTLIDNQDLKEMLIAVEQAKNKLESAIYCFRILTMCSESDTFKRRFLPVLTALLHNYQQVA